MPRFHVILTNLSRQKHLIDSFAHQIDKPLAPYPALPAFNLQFVAGNVYERIDITDSQAQIGDSYYGSTPSHRSSWDVSSPVFELLADLQRSLDNTRSLLEQRELSRHKDEYVQVCGWIAPPPVTVYHDKAYQVHLDHRDTGSWILKEDRLQHWMNDDLPRRSVLWMHGIPGAGMYLRHIPDRSLTSD